MDNQKPTLPDNPFMMNFPVPQGVNALNWNQPMQVPDNPIPLDLANMQLTPEQLEKLKINAQMMQQQMQNAQIARGSLERLRAMRNARDLQQMQIPK